MKTPVFGNEFISFTLALEEHIPDLNAGKPASYGNPARRFNGYRLQVESFRIVVSQQSHQCKKKMRNAPKADIWQ
jgi:hypothetical protein